MDRQEDRKDEKIMYARTMFWGDTESQNLIKELLDKVYLLQDKVQLLEENRERHRQENMHP